MTDAGVLTKKPACKWGHLLTFDNLVAVKSENRVYYVCKTCKRPKKPGREIEHEEAEYAE